MFGDLPAWAGSYTLDYNTELTHAAMYGSGRGYLAAAFFRTMMDYAPTARRNAAYCAFRSDCTCLRGTPTRYKHCLCAAFSPEV